MCWVWGIGKKVLELTSATNNFHERNTEVELFSDGIRLTIAAGWELR